MRACVGMWVERLVFGVEWVSVHGHKCWHVLLKWAYYICGTRCWIPHPQHRASIVFFFFCRVELFQRQSLFKSTLRKQSEEAYFISVLPSRGKHISVMSFVFMKRCREACSFFRGRCIINAKMKNNQLCNHNFGDITRELISADMSWQQWQTAFHIKTVFCGTLLLCYNLSHLSAVLIDELYNR